MITATTAETANNRQHQLPRFRRADFTTGSFEKLEGKGLPVWGGASHADDKLGWLVLGGRNIDRLGRGQRTGNVFTDLDFSGTFDASRILATYPPLDWTMGHGCLLRFPGPTATVTFYLSGDTDLEETSSELRGFLHHDDSIDATALEFRILPDHIVPKCGRAVDSKGRTHIFFTARDLSR